MKVVLINPPMLGLAGDPFGSIPFMPVGLLSVAAFLRSRGVEIAVIDGYGEAPTRMRFSGPYMISGLTLAQVVERIPADVDLVGISVLAGASHRLALGLIRRLKSRLPGIAVMVGGPHAAVLPEPFLHGGADFVVPGEGEKAAWNICRFIDGQIAALEPEHGALHARLPGVSPQPATDLDSLPHPAFDLIPRQNYWKLGVAHAPFRARYHPMVTSRGCPFQCAFCSTPLLSGQQWRGRTARRVVQEMEEVYRRDGVRDFFFQDDNFAVDRGRVGDICSLIRERGLDVSIHLPSGVTANLLDEEIVRHMGRSGFHSICLAPESGSTQVIRRMKKPVDLQHLERVMQWLREARIRTNAFIMVGYEGETREEFRQTRALVRKLTRLGVDEFSVFIYTPLPGARPPADPSLMQYENYEDLCWSPRWRPDYAQCRRKRMTLYGEFFLWKAAFHPLELARSWLRVITGRYETKGEMAFRRSLPMWGRLLAHRLSGKENNVSVDNS
ncbi:MAG: B12-binding domain-containing radical SAM protein [Deltaproteobacteria bacterium]|nr:B12-binding domain-containing radical SAM protein [Deltaproteobacteria bacterium]